MYTQKITISATNEYPALPDNLYALFAEKYNLPTLTQLRQIKEINMNTELLHVYLLDDYVSQDDMFLLEYRLSPERLTNELRIMCKQDQITQLLFTFNARGDRGISSDIIAFLKSLVHRQNIDIQYLDICFEGSREDNSRFIRERYIASFKWEESIRLYLHGSEDISKIRRK